ncbi:MAG: nickel pincer cofactor biosynthesis protein LarC [Candidatus Aminicenantes bacterium]|nr:nickel pincer cofactor biosynthesis protein LarC [Candidatus Aminicenantes bacterium]MBL7082079.1 nickel pincer cofactor biosynthesis protein LarC [Candidatus Aminicenantes bacterium]
MKYVYFDASAGLSGDMILGALLDLGVSPSLFKKKMAELKLPVDIQIKETKRASLRGLKVDVTVKTKKIFPRKWSDVETLIKKTQFSSTVKNKTSAIFKKLFEAEARVHGHKFHESHLHEAGADDAIVDILGSCYLAEVLNISEFYSSPLNVGQGRVKTTHGSLPVPPPAVAELLKGIPVYSRWIKKELVTPTGAAIVSTLVKKFIPFPEISYEKIGCGAGAQNFRNFPNILRAFYGNKKEFNANKRIYTIETNIDDSTPQVLAAFFDRAFDLGALDVFLTPVLMKKNRFATKLTVLAEIEKIGAITSAIFKETSSIGIRYYPVERHVLAREIKKINVLGQEVAIKISSFEGEEVNIQPEYSDCFKAAKKSGVPVKRIIQLALKEFYKKSKKSI